MGVAAPPPLARSLPNPRTTTLLGIFNINFSIILLACGLMFGLSMAVTPIIMNAMGKFQADLKNDMEKKRSDSLKALEKDAEAAQTAQEKADIEKRRIEIESRPTIVTAPMMDWNEMGLTDPMITGWWWIELLTGLVLNLCLLASGIGLLHCRSWAWKLGYSTAILKIARLTLLYLGFVIVIVPPMAHKMSGAVVKMMMAQQAQLGRPAGGGGLPPVDFIAKMYSVMYSVGGIGMIIFGSIYPLVMIWTLTRPGIRAACFPVRIAKPSTETGVS